MASLAAKTDFAAGSFMRGVIENNGDTGVIVRTDKWLSDEQRQQIVGALRDRKRRAGIADRPVLLLGSAEVLKPQLSSSDLQFLENRKFSRAEICAAFGVPEEIVTSTEHAKYDVMAGARLNFIENRVAPLCSRLEAAEAMTVRALDPRASGWFDLDSLPILQEARRTRLAAARAGFEMGVPFNELNRVLDLGFKPLPWGDEGWVPRSLTRVGPAEGNRRKAISEPADNEAPAGSGTGPGTRSKETLFPGGELLRKAELWVEGMKRNRPRLTPEVESKLKRFLFEQRGRVLARCAELQLPLTAAPEVQPGASQQNRNPHEAAEALVNRVFDVEAEGRALLSVIAALPERDGSTVPSDLNARIRELLVGELTACSPASVPELSQPVKALYNRSLTQIVP